MFAVWSEEGDDAAGLRGETDFTSSKIPYQGLPWWRSG